jgi:hypothetical protein
VAIGATREKFTPVSVALDPRGQGCPSRIVRTGAKGAVATS